MIERSSGIFYGCAFSRASVLESANRVPGRAQCGQRTIVTPAAVRAINDAGSKLREPSHRQSPLSSDMMAKRVAAALSTPTVPAFGSVIDASARSSRWSLALWLLTEEMPAAEIIPDARCLASALNACAKGSAAAKAVELLAAARSDDGRFGVPNAVAFNAAINACSRVGFWEGALQLLLDLQDDHEADVVAFTAAVTACKRGGQWRRAVDVMAHMQTSCVSGDVVAYGAAISACEKGKQWQWALNLLQRMNVASIDSDASSVSAAIAACATGGRWEQALGILSQTREASQEVGRVALAAALSACDRARAWKHALDALTRSLAFDSCSPGVEAVRGAVSACEVAGRPDVAPLGLLWQSLVRRTILRTQEDGTLRGELLGAAGELRDRDAASGAVAASIVGDYHRSLWKGLSAASITPSRGKRSRSLAKSTSHEGEVGRDSFVARLHDYHGPILQNLFEVGLMFCRTALQRSDSAGEFAAIGSCSNWLAFVDARAELHKQLLPSLWNARQAPAGAQLATWCSYDLILRADLSSLAAVQRLVG